MVVFKKYKERSMYPINPYVFSSKIIKEGLSLLWDASSNMSYPETGVTVFDLSGNINDGTLINGVLYNKNEMSGQFIFDGVNDYILGPVIEPQEYTIGVWFKSTGAPSANNDSTGGCLISNNPQNITGSGKYYIFYSYLQKRISIVYRTGTAYVIESVPDNTWHHISFTVKANSVGTVTDCTICLNGSFLYTSVAGVGITYPTTGVRNLSVGRWGYTGYNRYFKGNIPLVYMYNRAISEQEMLHNYNESKLFFNI